MSGVGIGTMIGAERIITEVGCKIISLPWILQLVPNAAEMQVAQVGLRLYC